MFRLSKAAAIVLQHSGYHPDLVAAVVSGIADTAGMHAVQSIRLMLNAFWAAILSAVGCYNATI